MFPELAEEEFNIEDYPKSELLPMEAEKIDDLHYEHFLEIERPYGTYEIKVYYMQVDKDDP